MIPLGMELMPEDEAFPTEREERERKKGEERKGRGRKRRRRGNRTRLTGRCQTMFGCPAYRRSPTQWVFWVDTVKIALKIL